MSRNPRLMFQEELLEEERVRKVAAQAFVEAQHNERSVYTAHDAAAPWWWQHALIPSRRRHRRRRELERKLALELREWQAKWDKEQAPGRKENESLRNMHEAESNKQWKVGAGAMQCCSALTSSARAYDGVSLFGRCGAP